MTPEQKVKLLNWVKTYNADIDNKVLTCTALDIETLCPRVYASPHGTYALYEVAKNLIFSIARKPTSANWCIPPDFDSYLQVYIGFDKQDYSKIRQYFYLRGCEFNIRKTKRTQLILTETEMKLTKFSVYDVLAYFESTRLDSIFVIF